MNRHELVIALGYDQFVGQKKMEWKSRIISLVLSRLGFRHTDF